MCGAAGMSLLECCIEPFFVGIKSRWKRTHFDVGSIAFHRLGFHTAHYLAFTFYHLKGMMCTTNRLLCASVIFFWAVVSIQLSP